MKKVILLALAGTAGTLARYWLGGVVQRLCGADFPWGTLVINASGCLLFGFVWTLAEERFLISGETRVIILTGFIGAYTTFSTFAFETAEQLRGTQWLLAAANLGAELGLGLACMFAGFFLGRLL